MPIKFYGTGAAAIVWDGVETINGQKTFSDTIVGDISSNGGTSYFTDICANSIVGDISSNGTSYFTDICANSIVGDISSNGTSYFTDICANRIYSNPDAGQALIIDSSLIIPDACLNILSNGYVGINTTTPATLLHVKYTTPRYIGDDSANTVDTTTWNGNPVGGRYYIIAVGGDGLASGKGVTNYDMNNLNNKTQSTGSWQNVDNKKETVIYAQGGNIMAGKEGGVPVGSGNYEPAAEDRWGTGGKVIAWWGTLNASDERIKYDIEDINDSSALEKLREIKPRTYKYRDDRALQSGGRGTVYGFIAQEVKSVFPQGVSILGEEHVPNIQEVGVYSSANKTITFTNFDTSGIPTSGVIKVITAKNECKYLNINYISIIDSHTIEVETDISEHCGAYDEENNEFIAGNNIYVEGCEVPDFHLLKKESIFTLATAALQEVDRQLQAEKAKTATLEAKTATLETKVATLEAENTDLRADIELIKEHLGISTEVG